VSDGECHGEDSQAECKGHTEEADSDRWKTRGQDSGAASTKDQPEGSEEFRERTFSDTQGFTSRVKLGYLSRFGFYPSAALADAINCHRATPEKYQRECDRSQS
jgi:hypothetical protein